MLDEEIFRVGSSSGGETILRPEKIRGGSVPQYTTRDRLARVRGYILMEILIDRYGRITQPRLLKGLTPGLDLKALAAICDWRFKPATAGGRPVSVYYMFTTSFDVS
jgi:protein TonB